MSVGWGVLVWRGCSGCTMGFKLMWVQGRFRIGFRLGLGGMCLRWVEGQFSMAFG